MEWTLAWMEKKTRETLEGSYHFIECPYNPGLQLFVLPAHILAEYGEGEIEIECPSCFLKIGYDTRTGRTWKAEHDPRPVMGKARIWHNGKEIFP